jgi:3-hydroxyisobutyrate dehydrogenase-like beta-hydroxyacid dehydrogenase
MYNLTSLIRAVLIRDKGMCKNLIEKGRFDKPLILFNRTSKRATDLSQSLPSGKSIVASSIQAAVFSADIIFTCVGDDAAINEIMDEALNGESKGKLFVDCSTVHPETTEGLAKKSKFEVRWLASLI